MQTKRKKKAAPKKAMKANPFAGKPALGGAMNPMAAKGPPKKGGKLAAAMKQKPKRKKKKAA